ncbi:MAG: DNA polymerase IV [Candidatus Eisenbacteria bacterium]|nr:DNA polymerase IV [Candidatus Eisenbacteria bacterium]
MRPVIMHVDIDAFFASVEKLKNPRLKDVPVIVGRGVIASCSYDARKYGLRAGMSIREAKKLCPKAVVLDGHCQTYRSFASRTFDICRDISPAVESYLDEAHCDLSGTELLYEDFLLVGRELKERVRREIGLTVTVGIATNRMIAKFAGRTVKPDGLRLIRMGEEENFIAGFPVGELPGVGTKTKRVLEKLGVHTIQDLRAFSRDSLRALFGKAGHDLYERAAGREIRVQERELPQSISRETAFHTPAGDQSEIEAMLYYLTERAGKAARDLAICPRTISVKVSYADSRHEERQEALPSPTALDNELFSRARDLLVRMLTRRVSVIRVGIALSRFSRWNESQMGFYEDEEEEKSRNLYKGIDSVRQKFGHSSIVAGNSIELLGKLKQDRFGFILRTPCLTR